MNFKLSKTALRELNAFYRAVLVAAGVSLLASTGANAAITVTDTGGTEQTVYTTDEIDAKTDQIESNQATIDTHSLQIEANTEALRKLNGDSTVVNSVDYKINQLATGQVAENTEKTNENAVAIATLNGDENTAGSVDQKIATAISSKQNALSAGTGISLDSTTNTISIADSSIDTTQIADGAVGTEQIADGAITKDKLDSTLTLAVEQITTNKTNISTNKNDIQTNAQNIQTNIENITKNTDAITQLKANENTEGSIAYATKQALNSANSYTDTEIAELANGQVAANTQAIETLNGDASTNGSVAQQVATSLQAAKDYADGKNNNALSEAQSYTDTKADETLTAAKSYTDTKADETLTAAKSYTDTKADETLTAAKSYTDTKANETLTAAQSYTDDKVTELATGQVATNTAKINENTNAINNIIDGTTTLAKVTTSGNADIGGNLNVTGNTTLTGTLSATGGIETNNIKLNGKEISEVDTGTIAVSGAGNNKTVATTASVMKSAQNAEFTPGGSNAAGKKTINEAINALDTEIGADSDYGTLLNGDASKTVKENIAALDASIGKVADINAGNALTNGTGTKPTTVVEALNNVDATLGTVHGLRDKLQASGAGTNLAAGTTVEQHLTALDASIGNRSYSSTNYISSGSDLSSAVASLDNNLYRVEGDLSALKSRANKMHHEMKSGFASLAAMSALVPNARTAGDTQLSVGTGYYRGTTGFALGAFHHINDNVLLNAGAAYGGNGAATFKGGVTFGW